MKRILSILLAAIMVAGCLPLMAFAAAPAISGSNETTEAGGSATVSFTVSESTFSGYKFEIKYDSTVLTLTDISKGAASEGYFQKNVDGKKVTLAAGDNITKSGTLFTATFSVAQNAAPDTYPVSISGTAGLYDENGVEAKNEVYVEGSVTIKEPEHTHNYTKTTVAPTCTEQGYDLYECECKDSYKDNYVEALGHDWTEWTKKDAEQHTRSCDRCGEVENGDHAWGEWIVDDEPNCKDDGKKHRECSVCKAREDGTIPSTGDHNYELVSDTATCGQDGVKTYKCDGCGDTYTENSPATDEHDWGKPVYDSKHTCIDREATYTCKVCGETKTETVKATTKHEYKNWKDNGDGTHTGTCDCGKTKTKDHNWNNGKVTEKATCSEDGVKTYTCKDCGAKKTEVIPATGKHDYTHDYKKIDKKQHKAYCACGDYIVEDHEFQYNGYCVCGYKKPVASTAGLDDVPKTGDITGQLVFGASAAVIALMAAAAFVFKRKTAK